MYEAKWKEQKLNKNELSKLKEDGLDVFKDLPELVKKPFSAIDPAYYMYFKYAGLTVQKPKKDGNFMMRVKIPGGILTTKQGHHLAEIAETYGKGLLDITTRQSVQYHWIPFRKLPEIFEDLKPYGLTTAGAEGDITRNVIDNPLAGIDPFELFDTRPTVRRVHQRFQNNRDYSNLPRKMKISISSNVYNAGNAEINDLAFVPASKRINGRKVLGFNVKVGGGLGALPQLGKPLDIFVTRSQVAELAEAVVTLYRDHGPRRNRAHARLKFLIQDWGLEKFEAELRQKLPELPTAGKDELLGWNGGTVLGLHEQKQAGFYYLGIGVAAGRLPAADFRQFLQIADNYGTGEIRFDHSQNLIIPGIPKQQLAALKNETILQQYSYQEEHMANQGLACTGSQYCNMAHTRSKEILNELLPKLDQRFTFKRPPRIVVTGCANGCAHRSIADIGIEGVAARNKNKEVIEAFKISLGGTLKAGGHFAQTLRGVVPTGQLEAVVTALLTLYQTHHQGETFAEYVERSGLPTFQKVLDAIIE